MSRFEKYLIEGSYPTNKTMQKKFDEWCEETGRDTYTIPQEFFTIWDLIKKDCKPTLNLIKENEQYFFRGMKHVGNEYGYKDVRKDRKPKDTNPIVSNIIDNILYDEFGWKPRSEGLFVSCNREFVNYYGDIYYIFPVGKFKYLWSPFISDSYTAINNMSLLNGNDYEAIFGVDGVLGDKGKWVVYKSYYSVIGSYTNKQAKTIEDAIKLAKKEFGNFHRVQWETDISKGDFFNNIENYYDKYPKIKKVIDDNLEYILDKELKYKDSDINAAMESDNEIIISTPKYYYIKYNRNNNFLLLFLLGV